MLKCDAALSDSALKRVVSLQQAGDASSKLKEAAMTRKQVREIAVMPSCGPQYLARMLYYLQTLEINPAHKVITRLFALKDAEPEKAKLVAEQVRRANALAYSHPITSTSCLLCCSCMTMLWLLRAWSMTLAPCSRDCKPCWSSLFRRPCPTKRRRKRSELEACALLC